MSDAGRRLAAPLPAWRRKGRTAVALGVLIPLAVAVAAAAWHYRGAAPLWPLAAGTLLAFLGLAALFGVLAGFVRLYHGGDGRDFLNGLADAIGEACVVTDRRGAPLYANAAHLELATQSGVGRLV